eukprot:UN03987
MFVLQKIILDTNKTLISMYHTFSKMIKDTNFKTFKFG